MKKKVLLMGLCALFGLASCDININLSLDKPTQNSQETDNDNESGFEGDNSQNTGNDNNGQETEVEAIKETILTSQISSTETQKMVKNPGCGFYKARELDLTENGVENASTSMSENMYHLRISLAAFTSKMGGKDIEIPKKALDSLDNYLAKYAKADVSVIVRFAYDAFDNKKDVEPSMSLILKHIEALGPVVSKYNNVEAIECGLIGPWGEMHSSVLDTQDTYNQLFPKWLASTSRVPILSRKPRYAYRFMGYKLDSDNDKDIQHLELKSLDKFEYKEEEYKRIGIFNDGYLGTSKDTGTYLDREKEVEWMENFLTTPYGGEVITGTSPLTYIPLEVHQEQFKTHLSYLNGGFDHNVTDRWKETIIEDNIPGYKGFNLYTFMNNHMGYGFLFDTLEAYKLNDKSYLKLNLQTVGYKKYLNDFDAEIVLVNEANEVVNTYPFKLDCLEKEIEFDGETNCKVYLRLSDTLGRKYKLLNDESIYENTMNYIGEIM